jgi:hypothetical protein
MSSDDYMDTEWTSRDHAVETIQSLTAIEGSDSFLMSYAGLLKLCWLLLILRTVL